MESKAVEFYEKMKRLQDQNQECERMRLMLEKEMSKNVSPNARMNKLKAAQLCKYWKKICEDEKRNQRQNEQLLRDLDRIDKHIALLGEKTERMYKMKFDYENYIEQTYPNWREKVLNRNCQPQPKTSTLTARQVSDTTNADECQEVIKSESKPVEYCRPEVLDRLQEEGKFQPIAQQQERDTFQSMNQEQETDDCHQPSRLREFNLSSESDEFKSLGTIIVKDSQKKAASTNQKLDVTKVSDVSSFYSLQNGSFAHKNQDHSKNEDHSVKSDRLTANEALLYQQTLESNIQPSVLPNSASIMMNEHTLLNVVSSQTKDKVCLNKVLSADSQNPENSLGKCSALPNEASANMVQRKITVEEVHDFVDSAMQGKMDEDVNKADEMLNTSSFAADRTYASEISEYEVKAESNVAVSNSITVPIRSRDQRMLQSGFKADVSLDGFIQMLTVVEDEIASGKSHLPYFQSMSPSTSVVQEIIESANRKSTLSHLNAESITMVILEQLPWLSMSGKNSCLLTDQILISFKGEINNRFLRLQLDPSDHLLWDSLYQLFLVLLRYKVLQPIEIADIFSPLLIAANSRMLDQAIVVMTKVLESVPVEEISMPSPNSTSDFSFVSPRKSEVTVSISQHLVRNLEEDPASIHQLNKKGSIIVDDNDNDDDDILVIRDPISTVSLTAAYKQHLASLSSKEEIAVESEEDDEIEKNLSLHFTENRLASSNMLNDEHIQSPKSLDNCAGEKVMENSDLKQEYDHKNSMTFISGLLKSGRSTINDIISRAQDDVDFDEDEHEINVLTTKSKEPDTKHNVAAVANDEEDDDFWA